MWAPRRNHLVFNSQGLRGEEIGHKKGEREYRIFAIGDSNTLGWIGEDGSNWPMYLEEILTEKRKDRDFIVINAGVYGYTSFQGLRRLKQILPLKPDMVLISFGGNDAHTVYMSDEEFYNKVSSVYNPLLFKFRMGQLLIAFREKVVALKHRQKKVLVHRVSVEEYKRNLLEMINICRENNIRCILLTRPYINRVSRGYVLNQFLNSPEFKGVCENYRGRIDRFVRDICSALLEDKEQQSINPCIKTLLVEAHDCGAAIRALFTSTEFVDGDVRDEEYLRLLYRMLLRRSPDPGGYSFWLRQLKGSELPEDSMWWRRFAPLYYEATIEVAENSGVPLIDVYSYFKDKEDYFADESHFNEGGHRLAARFLYDQLSPIIP